MQMSIIMRWVGKKKKLEMDSRGGGWGVETRSRILGGVLVVANRRAEAGPVGGRCRRAGSGGGAGGEGREEKQGSGSGSGSGG